MGVGGDQYLAGVCSEAFRIGQDGGLVACGVGGARVRQLPAPAARPDRIAPIRVWGDQIAVLFLAF